AGGHLVQAVERGAVRGWHAVLIGVDERDVGNAGRVDDGSPRIQECAERPRYRVLARVVPHGRVEREVVVQYRTSEPARRNGDVRIVLGARARPCGGGHRDQPENPFVPHRPLSIGPVRAEATARTPEILSSLDGRTFFRPSAYPRSFITSAECGL